MAKPTKQVEQFVRENKRGTSSRVEKKRSNGDAFTTGQRSSHRAALCYGGFQHCLFHCWSGLLVVMKIPSHDLLQLQHSLHQSQGYHLQGQKYHAFKTGTQFTCTRFEVFIVNILQDVRSHSSVDC